MPGLDANAADCPQGNPLTAHKFATRTQQVIHRGVFALAAGTGTEGPGPLVSNMGKTAGTFPIPVAIVPGHLSDEDLDAMS